MAPWAGAARAGSPARSAPCAPAWIGPAAAAAPPLLAVRGLDVCYGRTPALRGWIWRCNQAEPSGCSVPRAAARARGHGRSARERDYVRSARGFGGSRWYVLRRHIWPETYSVALTQAALLAPQFILAEVALGFLGLGAAPPTASWGAMLAGLLKLYVLESYAWLFAPAVALVVVVLLYDWLATSLAA